MELIAVLLIIAGVALLAIWLYITRQGDAQIEFLMDQRTPVIVESNNDKQAVFTCKIPFVNKGTQDGTIMDCYPRHLMPYEYFNACQIATRLTLDSAPRQDGYWEAAIIFKTKGDAIVLTMTFMTEDGDIREALSELPDLPVDIVFQVVARSDWYITKQRLLVPAAEIRTALQQSAVRQ